jgi:hypothetical protein
MTAIPAKERPHDRANSPSPMNDYVWDQDFRMILASIIRSTKCDIENVEANVELAARYAETVAKRRAARSDVEDRARPQRR